MKKMLMVLGLLGIAAVCAASYVYVQMSRHSPLADRFHIGNKPYSEVRIIWGWGSPRLSLDYAIWKFPDFAACRKNTLSGVELNLDWNRISGSDQAKICFFLLAEELGSPEKLIEWFRGNGYSTYMHDQLSEWPINKPASVSVGYIFSDQDKDHFGGFRFWVARKINRPVSVVVGYDAARSVISAGVSIGWE